KIKYWGAQVGSLDRSKFTILLQLDFVNSEFWHDKSGAPKKASCCRPQGEPRSNNRRLLSIERTLPLLEARNPLGGFQKVVTMHPAIFVWSADRFSCLPPLS